MLSVSGAFATEVDLGVHLDTGSVTLEFAHSSKFPYSGKVAALGALLLLDHMFEIGQGNTILVVPVQLG